MGNTQDAETYKPSKDKTWKAYCAIDVGAVSCGYAYSFDDVKHIWMNKNWAESLGYFARRAPSALLRDQSGTPVLFGFEACERYMSMSKEEIKQVTFEYEGLLNISTKDIGLATFKKEQYSDSEDSCDDSDDSTATEDASASVKSGQKQKKNFLPQEVLKARCEIALLLAKHCKQEIENKYSYYKKTPDEFVWVILVPFTWDIVQKRIFRKAVQTEFSEHFIEQFKSDEYKLELVTSTEALWLASKEQVLENLNNSKHLFKKDNKKGEKAVVFIHSGGTRTEISVHKKSTGAQPVEIVSLELGGRYVNNLFEEYLAKSLKFDGARFVKECKEHYDISWLDLALKFETARKAVHYAEESNVSIDLSYGFSEAYVKITEKQLTEAMSEMEKEDEKKIVLSKSGKLILNGKLTSQMCTNVMELIYNELDKVMNNYGLRYRGILMTGGFGESIFAREYLSSKQEKNEMNPVTLYTPENSTSLMTLGAITSAKQKHELGHTIGVLYPTKIEGKLSDKLFPIMFKGQTIEVGEYCKFGPLQYLPVDHDGCLCVDIVYIPELLKPIKKNQYYEPFMYKNRVKIGTLSVNVLHKDPSKLHHINIHVTRDFRDFKVTMMLITPGPKKTASLKLDYMPEEWVKRVKHKSTKGKLLTEDEQNLMDPKDFPVDEYVDIPEPAATTTGESLSNYYTQSYTQAVAHGLPQ